MKKFSRSVLFLAVSGTVLGTSAVSASTQLHPPGALWTHGKSVNHSSLLSVTANPAAGSMVVAPGEKVRTGYLSSISFGLEVGDVDNFQDEIDDLIDELDRDDVGFQDAEDTIDRFNAILPEMGREGYLHFEGTLHAPAFPIAIQSDLLQGVVTLDLQASGAVNGRLLDDALTYNSAQKNLESNSALYLKSAMLTTASIGFSREVWQPTETSKLYLGATGNLYRASISKQLLKLQALNGESLSDVIRDEYDNNEQSSTQFGLDLGLLWTLPYGQVGLTIANINEPEFEYGSLNRDCAALNEPQAQENCAVAINTFAPAGRIALDETVTFDTQITLEGAVYTPGRNWLLAGSLDTNSVYDLVGMERQWLTLSATYFADSYLIPNARIGVRKNLAGSELTYLNLGTTLFGVANLDLGYSLDSTEIDGSSTPRGLAISFGFEEKF